MRQLSVVGLTLALLAGNLAVCAGWTATAQARMACCSDTGSCPMHGADTHESQRVVTQAQADACCASSEAEQPGPSGAPFALAITPAVLGPGVSLPASPPALVLSDGWRIAAPVPSPPIPKRLLLSVFLV